MKVGIIGGTGFIGGYLVDALLDAGHMPRVLVRPGSEKKLGRPGDCEIVSGDVSDVAAVGATVDGCDAAIYCVGILREDRSKGITFEALQQRGAERMVDAAKQHGVRRYLLMSANGVHADGTAYQRTKYLAERAVLDSGLDATVFRPSVVFGDPQGKMEIATQLFSDVVKLPLPAPGFTRGLSPSSSVTMSPVHVRDVADAMVAALPDPATCGKTFVLGGPETLSWSEMVRRVAKATGRHKAVLPTPIPLMRIPATLLGWLPGFPVTNDQLTMLAEGNDADSSALEQLIARPATAFSADNLSYLNV
jgi:NADH dehydrogenase